MKVIHKWIGISELIGKMPKYIIKCIPEKQKSMNNKF